MDNFTIFHNISMYFLHVNHTYVFKLHCVGDCLLYFGFGSNLLAARIQHDNPTAVFYTTARLSDYRLDFDCVSCMHGGASATVIPSPDDHVWGVVWLIKHSEIASLDAQEGVQCNVYKVVVVGFDCSEGRLK